MERQRSILWLLVGGLGLLLVACSLSCALLVVVLPMLSLPGGGTETLPAVPFLAATAITAGFSVALATVSWRAWRGLPSPLVYPRRAWITLALLWLLAAVGVLLFPGAPADSPLFAVFHLAMIALPALLLFSFATLAAGRRAALTWRQATVGVTAGALSTLFAMVAELIGFVLIAGFVAAVTPLVPGGQAELERLLGLLEPLLQQPAPVMTEEEILRLVASPVILAVLVLILAVLTPVIEEFAKTITLSFITYRQRPDRARAFLWGVACGLGFALIEGAFNGALSMNSTEEWAAGVAMRIPATAMHALTSGLIGLGWGYFWQKRKRWMLPLGYLASIVFHGVWNFNAVTIIGGTAVTELAADFSLPGNLLLYGGGGFLLLLATLAPVGLIALPWWLRRRKSSPLPREISQTQAQPGEDFSADPTVGGEG